MQPYPMEIARHLDWLSSVMVMAKKMAIQRI